MRRIPLFLLDLLYLQCQCQRRRSLNKVCSCFILKFREEQMLESCFSYYWNRFSVVCCQKVLVWTYGVFSQYRIQMETLDITRRVYSYNTVLFTFPFFVREGKNSFETGEPELRGRNSKAKWHFFRECNKKGVLLSNEGWPAPRSSQISTFIRSNCVGENDTFPQKKKKIHCAWASIIAKRTSSFQTFQTRRNVS